MKIGIIDAELIYNKKHRFPNLVSMKISGYHKNKGGNVSLLLNYDDIEKYDKVYISKVFTDTQVPEKVLAFSNIQYGGTGFFYDKAPPLPYEIEHCMPDYHLYDEWVKNQLENGITKKLLKYYTDYSIGFATRGCIRQCNFCVNKHYKKSEKHSGIAEFIDNSRPYICLLDDNVLACSDWKIIFDELISTGKRLVFKQGIDERLLTDEKCDYIFNKIKWIGDYIFAFDNIADKDLIISKLKLIRKYTDKKIKFYVLCGYNHQNNIYDEEFWKNDIISLFERIKILIEYGCIPYVMRYEKYNSSCYRGIYINAAAWCNQPNLFKKMTFSDFCKQRGMSVKGNKIYRNDFKSYIKDGNKKGAAWRYLDEFTALYPDVAEKYFCMKGEI